MIKTKASEQIHITTKVAAVLSALVLGLVSVTVLRPFGV